MYYFAADTTGPKPWHEQAIQAQIRFSQGAFKFKPTTRDKEGSHAHHKQ